jgi:hypothetical protein
VARLIKVKTGPQKYTLKGDNGLYIGELEINYRPNFKTCSIAITKKGAEVTDLTIKSTPYKEDKKR